jgi:hypothetical protein
LFKATSHQRAGLMSKGWSGWLGRACRNLALRRSGRFPCVSTNTDEVCPSAHSRTSTISGRGRDETRASRKLRTAGRRAGGAEANSSVTFASASADGDAMLLEYDRNE